MPLLVCDLDDTLVDRVRVFAAWAGELARRHQLGAETHEWLVMIDERGSAPREEFWSAVRERFNLPAEVGDLVAEWIASFPDRYPREPPVLEELISLRDEGWTLAIVTNGGADVQARKLAASGLDQIAHVVCISGVIGLRKPDRAIFDLAAQRAHQPLLGGWMIGDNPREDIEGGHDAGLKTIWLQRERAWPLDSVTPDLTVDDILQALRHVRTSG
ncbi:HAD family hydrolase [Lapillicoccus sp.]|uniref:HAD family hydrolase n=1 Tax=Lapillicoccus sp. TaxID=1909287 RepID=UPI0025F3DC13|nr:HAD family hydrolase [Lapillicoccus sp.]